MPSGLLQRPRNESRSQHNGIVRLYPNPFMDEIRVKAVMLWDSGNRCTGLGAFLDNLASRYLEWERRCGCMKRLA